jgi:hypothetical protein
MRGGFEGYNWVYIILALIPVIAVAVIMGFELAVKPSVPTSLSPSSSPLDHSLDLQITNVNPNSSFGTPTSLSVYTLPNIKSAYGNSIISYSLALFIVEGNGQPMQDYNFESSQPYTYDPTGKTFEVTIPPPPQNTNWYSAKIDATLFRNGSTSRGNTAEYTYSFPNKN